jgi:hypothetical protein
MFVEDCGDEHFPDDGVFNNGKCFCVLNVRSLIQCPSDDDNVILFSRQPAEYDGKFNNHFSVTFPGQMSAKGRVIVEHLGENSGVGTWTCSKDRGSSCGHITSARHHLQKLLHADPEARDHRAHESLVVQVVAGMFHITSYISL